MFFLFPLCPQSLQLFIQNHARSGTYLVVNLVRIDPLFLRWISSELLMECKTRKNVGMTFPWKKTKCRRFSQFVADRLQSRKPGDLFVVETGFPTSLIDLFVKNRERLKKAFKKKQSSTPMVVPCTSPLISSSNRAIEDCVLERDKISPSLNDSGHQTSKPIKKKRFNSVVAAPYQVLLMQSPSPPLNISNDDEIARPDGVIAPNEKENGEKVYKEIVDKTVNRNGILLSMLKVFFVVVLALGAEKFVVGITLSAFLLCFLELVGKFSCNTFSTCLDAQNLLKSVVARMLLFIGRKQDGVDDLIRFDKNPDDQIRDARFAELKSNFANLVIPTAKDSAGSHHSKRSFMNEGSLTESTEREESYESGKVSELEKSDSYRAKVKSKMKKLVLKKLTRSKKEYLDSKKQVDELEELRKDKDGENFVQKSEESRMGSLEKDQTQKFDAVYGELSKQSSRASISESEWYPICVGSSEADSTKRFVLRGERKMFKFSEFKYQNSEFKRKNSRRSKMMSKMKKLVLGKLRRTKKDSCDANVKCFGAVEGEELDGEELDKDAESFDLKLDERFPLLPNEIIDGQDCAVDSICSSSELSRAKLAETVAEAGEESDARGWEGKETEGGCGYLCLCLVVLVGLVGGWILALVLVLSWCLMLKTVNRSTRRFRWWSSVERSVSL